MRKPKFANEAAKIMYERKHDNSRFDGIGFGLSKGKQRSLAQALADELGIEYSYDKDVYEGDTEPSDGGYAISCGLRELRTGDGNIGEFVAAVVTMHHEAAHRRHFTEFPDRDTDMSRYIMLNYYACRCSSEYYYGKGFRNYYTQPYEMVAQYEALCESYKFFKRSFGDADLAEKLICAYVNHRMDLGAEFVSHSPFEKVGDIADAFSESFEASKTLRRSVSLDPFVEYLEDGSTRVVPDPLSNEVSLAKRWGYTNKLDNAIKDPNVNLDLLLAQIGLTRSGQFNNESKRPWAKQVDFRTDTPYFPRTAKDSGYGALARIAEIDSFDDSAPGSSQPDGP